MLREMRKARGGDMAVGEEVALTVDHARDQLRSLGFRRLSSDEYLP